MLSFSTWSDTNVSQPHADSTILSAPIPLSLFCTNLREPSPTYVQLGIQLKTKSCLCTFPGRLFVWLPHSNTHCPHFPTTLSDLISIFNLLSPVRPCLLLRLHFPIFCQVPLFKRSEESRSLSLVLVFPQESLFQGTWVG